MQNSVELARKFNIRYVAYFLAIDCYVLQAMERLETRDTLNLGTKQIMDVLSGVTPEELPWFLRAVFSEQ